MCNVPVHFAFDVFAHHAASPCDSPRARIFKLNEHERYTYVYSHYFLFFSADRIELPRFLDRNRATASSGYSRNYQMRRTKAGSGKSRYAFWSGYVFWSFRRSLASRLYPRVPFSFRFRARTQNRVHARKILCRIRRYLARGHNSMTMPGVWKVYPAKELKRGCGARLVLGPGTSSFINKLRQRDRSWPILALFPCVSGLSVYNPGTHASPRTRRACSKLTYPLISPLPLLRIIFGSPPLNLVPYSRRVLNLAAFLFRDSPKYEIYEFLHGRCCSSHSLARATTKRTIGHENPRRR